MKTLADGSDDARRGPGHPVVTVYDGNVAVALKKLKRALANNGTFTARKRAQIARASERVKFKKAGARRRQAKVAWRRARQEAFADWRGFREKTA